MNLFIFLFSIFITLTTCAIEIRYLDTPKLGSENILQKIVCHRPGRDGAPRIEREAFGNKSIIHDYGHGGGGWTMAWGAAEEAVSLICKEDNIEDIAIIGSGISGLAAAYMLVKAGRIPKAIIAREFDNLTSHKAGGLFAHQSRHTDKLIRDKINGWIIKSLETYQAIAQKTHPDFTLGARNIPGYFVNRETSDLEECVKAGVIQPGKDVIVDFKNGTQKNMVVYDDNVFIDTHLIMECLKSFLEGYKIPFITKEITNFNELPYSVIFNCTGLGARELVPQDKNSIIPVQGHLILLKNQNFQDLNYTLELDLGTSLTDTGLPILNLLYILPKRLLDSAQDEIGVLGGTFIKGAYIDTPHIEEFDRILQRAREFFGIK